MIRAIILAFSIIFGSVHAAVAELPTVKGSFSSSKTNFTFEVAATNSDRAVGLMYRKELPLDHGMIFVYPTARSRSFWMKNTFIPLDLLFLDKRFRVQGIIENAKPLSTGHLTLDDEIESVYVVELAGGVAKQEGIKPGDTLLIADTLPQGQEGP